MSEFKPTPQKLPSPQERLDLVLKVLGQTKSVTDLAAEAGISRTLMYRWLGRVRKAAMTALESEEPGPKPPKGQEAQDELQKVKEQLQQAQKELAKERKENVRLAELARVSKEIIRKQGWGPHPDDTKKNGVARKQRGGPPSNRGQNSAATLEPGTTQASGGSTAPPSGAGGGPSSSTEGGGES